MLQERIEGKRLDAFRRAFRPNEIGSSTPVAIVAETQSRPVLAELSALALHDLGAVYHTIVMPTPPQTAPVPVKSTGISNAIAGQRPVIEALKRVEVIVDVTVEGLIHAEEWPEIEEAGTQLLVVCNEHPEILERTEPRAELGPKVALGIEMLRAASEMCVTSAHGTNLAINLRSAPCGGTPGFGTHPGAVAHWPGGLCLGFSAKGAVNGRFVMALGDMNLTFKTYLASPIGITVEDDYVTAIRGDNLDADLFREYLAAWDDRNAYGMSQVGWGMNPGARRVSAALYGKRDMRHRVPRLGWQPRLEGGGFLGPAGHLRHQFARSGAR